ncbi:hypothetical protein KY285_008442 [Solanum tuberosum]|nr:hypothetical protein KY285_008442 [Solanum tuberosum]
MVFYLFARDAKCMLLLTEFPPQQVGFLKYDIAEEAAAIVGEVLAMRLKVEGLDQGQGNGIHVNVNKEVEKKGFKNRTKVWAIVNGLKSNGVKLILDDNENDTSRPNFH